MAAGKPVLVSKTKSFKRIIHETHAGTLVDIDTAENLSTSIRDFIKKSSGLEGRLGRKAVENKYNWETDKKTLLHFVGGYLK